MPGVSISVDLILSDIASTIGFEVEQILILPIGKGNSSQQMACIGVIKRKCICVEKERQEKPMSYLAHLSKASRILSR